MKHLAARIRDFLLTWYPLIFFAFLLNLAFGTLTPSRNGVIWSDAEGYYMYLPALFIYQGFEDIPVRTTVQFSRFPGTGKYFTKYTCGVAMMELPFFLALHYLAGLRGLPQDGYGDPYIDSILMAAAFYCALGFFFLRKVLDRYVDRGITLLTIVCLFAGTNMYFYTIKEPGTSHIFSFCLFALFIYLTPRFYEKPGAGLLAGMGLLTGLIVLIRPTNGLVVLYLLFFDVASTDDLKARLAFFRRHAGRLLLVPLSAFLVFIPQFLYWKYISGDFLIYSYGDEGFSNWASPKFFHILFDVKNGWLLFSPVMFFSLFGLYQGVCRNVYNMRLIAVITGLALYLFASWWMWWFGGGFGYRTMIEFYALLAIPLAFFNSRFFQNYPAVARIGYVLLLAGLIRYSTGLAEERKDKPNYNWWTWHQAVDKVFFMDW